MRRSLRLRGLRSLKSYTYDDAGRTTSVVSSAGTTSLSYDYEGRLTQITYPGAATNTFTYNALDTRVGKVDSAGTATYKRDGVDVTDPVLSDGAAAYTPGISERRSSATKYLHEDFLGSTTRLTDSNQATTDTRQYDAFGNVVSTSGSNPMPFGFAGGWGYQTDSDSGLQLLGHRYYDPSTGRFLTRDPARDGRNWYGYCRNNPAKWVDPNGHFIFAAILIGIAGYVIIKKGIDIWETAVEIGEKRKQSDIDRELEQVQNSDGENPYYQAGRLDQAALAVEAGAAAGRKGIEIVYGNPTQGIAPGG